MNDWIGASRYERSYDSNGNEILDVTYTWDSDVGDWSTVEKTIYYYSHKDPVSVHSPDPGTLKVYPNRQRMI